MSNAVTNLISLGFWLCQCVYRAAKGAVRLAPSGTFVLELIRQPGKIGAVCSSSPILAQTMAKQVPLDRHGLVVELGAGTGAVTSALLERGIAPERLLVIEQSSAFVQHLRHRYPQITILRGDAAELERYVPAGATVAAIVSSLPLRSLSSEEVTLITTQWRQLLPRKGRVVQFTYDLRGLTRRTCQGFVEQSGQVVWRNLPPARVVTLLRDFEPADDNDLKRVA